MAFERVAGLDEVPAGKVHVVEIDGMPIALCNVDGAIYAIDDVCTHDEGPLDQGELDGVQIECPRHGARFDVRTGKALRLPAVVPVHTYTVELRDGAILVDPDS
ncbi:MAG TPA: non-heme iron oxygenase ferredoxin subunit [Dehalococcoidia bacterium]|nr:non-heme iron oxygenase ferredoxin subunit [Dehalococcoidia bacterium]